MPDIFTKEKRSEVMSLIKSRNTKPEIAFRKLVSSYFYPLGYRYRINYKRAFGKPDVVFVSLRLAIFIDGSFWHGFDFENRKHKLPKVYWLEKIQKNIERDKKVNKNLKKAGWKVIRIWEHELKKRPEKVLISLQKHVDKQKKFLFL